MELNLQNMRVPVSAEQPSGANEEYNPLYLQLEELATGKPASVMGDSTVEGIEPDWRTLQKNCVKLWETTRDLRVVMYLCISGLSLHGLKGFSDALCLAEYLVAERWNDFYPQLDPDDGNDPTERLNVLAMISPMPGCYSDPLMFISKFRTVKLIDGKDYTLRDFLIAEGELEAADSQLDPLLFKGEMNAVPLNVMQENKALADKIFEQVNAIAETVNSHLDGVSVSFASLLTELKELRKFYQSHCIAAEELSEPEESAGKESVAQNISSPARKPGTYFDLASFVPGNRAEALLMLQKGAEYFQTAEPTSPVPLLVSRAIRMSNMSFLDLLGDIESSALEKGREIFGVKPEQQ